MKYCSHCGKEISEHASQCPHCGEKIQPNFRKISLSKPHMALAGCSVLSVVFLFLDWIKMNLFGFAAMSFSPVSLFRHLNDFQEMYGDYMPEEYVNFIPLICIFGVVLVVSYIITAILAVKASSTAYKTGMFANAGMAFLTGLVLYIGKDLAEESYGMLYLTGTVKLALAVALAGVVISIWLFIKEPGSASKGFEDTVSFTSGFFPG